MADVTDDTITPLLSLLLQLCPAAANKDAAPKQKVQGSCSDVCQQRTRVGGGDGEGWDGWVGGFAELQEGGTTTSHHRNHLPRLEGKGSERGRVWLR